MEDKDIVELAMKEVKEVLDKYEVAAIVVLHRPGHTEPLVKIETPFSCARTEGETVKIRAKLEDFKGNKDVRKKKLLDTSVMFRKLLDTCITKIYPYFEVSEELDEKLIAKGIKD